MKNIFVRTLDAKIQYLHRFKWGMGKLVIFIRIQMISFEFQTHNQNQPQLCLTIVILAIAHNTLPFI